ncbi:MAG: hypothetical protein H9917_06460 [Candidatus Oceanisphaera merdipullorum]|nr:hypothetical protein [Candidatus Oceanisphaera merdipullorum]
MKIRSAQVLRDSLKAMNEPTVAYYEADTYPNESQPPMWRQLATTSSAAKKGECSMFNVGAATKKGP